MRRLAMIGAGGHGRSVAEAVLGDFAHLGVNVSMRRSIYRSDALVRGVQRLYGAFVVKN